MKQKLYFLILTSLVLCSCTGSPERIKVEDLRSDYLGNSAGTGKTPLFSWIITSTRKGLSQTAYQILLSENTGPAGKQKDYLWDSGKVPSDQTIRIDYKGPDLKSGTQYIWKVRIWDNNDNPSSWSKTETFITSLFEEADWNNAGWIGYEDIPDSLLLIPGVHGNGNNLGEVAKKRTVIPCFRKEINIKKKIRKAIVFVSGLGQYEFYINGNKIGDHFLAPGWTNYLKTVYYNTFEVTDFLNQGQNALAAVAGNGFYNINRERYRKLVIAYGAPKIKLKLAISYNDGTTDAFVTDGSWKTAQSPITFTSIYGGEDYDARLEQPGWDRPGFDDSDWHQAMIVKDPGGMMKPEKDYPVKIIQSFDPVSIFSPDTNRFVYDFGQNASGIILLSISGKEGSEVKLFPGELLDNDSLVTQRASGSPYYFSYTLNGKKDEVWQPRFTYYGFRYVEVRNAVPAGMPNPENLPEIKVLKMLHTRNSSPEAGSFRCSNDLFNSVFDLINWSVKSNLASVATDCPHREKLGWLEQTHLMGNSIKYLYDIRNLYNKIIDDMIEAQLDNGLVPDIAPEYVPFVGGFRDSPEWGSAAIILPWDLYEWYGDIGAVKKAYPMMKRYLAYLESMSENHILSHGLGDWYDLGPKFPGEAQLTPKALTATSIYYYDAKLLSKMAAVLGEKTDYEYFSLQAEEIRVAFNNKFLDPVTNIYSTGSQTAFAMPLWFRMPDDSIRDKIVENLVSSVNLGNKALTAGDIGYRYLLRVLEEEGHSRLIYEMNYRNDVPGYGFQLSKGATSLTESWAGLKEVSNNHMMLGHLMEWFFSGLGGIRQAEDSQGYKHIIIKPEPVGDVKWAETVFKTIHGEIMSSWKISDGFFNLSVKIPPGCTATISIPQADPDEIWEEGIPVGSSGWIKNISSDNKRTWFDISSGEYEFKATISE